MVPGILGKKIGMTQIFGEDGRRTPVTVVKAGPCSVQAVKTPKKDGYSAVRMGYEDVKEKRVKKPQREELKSRNLKPKRFVREIRCDETLEVKVGDEVTLGIFQKGDFLDITGISKGKGFQGGMKRHGWYGGQETHGSMSHRAPGSIGASSFPSRVFKGQTMPGQMGNVRTTIQNVQIVDTDAANNTIAVRGAIPGANGTYLIIRYAKKKPLAPRSTSSVIPAKAGIQNGKE
ncbi:MAG: 50S ribosomal protein L3 [Candidatus Omnitrophota bacterium]